MPNIDLSILNQRQTPAFYADVLANRPAAGFIGRIFVSTNTYEFYRDNGTGWDLIGGPGAGTITGSGAAGQVSYWNGASTITGSNDLFFDDVNGHLGINTTTPETALDVHHDQSTLLQLNQTTGSNDTRIAFQNNGVALWRIGNFYNGTANDFGIFDVVGAQASVTVKKTTGQVLIGTSTVGAGKLVVSSTVADNGIQIAGASSPSLRIDNAVSGATKRAGLGIATALNNFIQGAVDRDFCIFNGSTAAASPMLFGIYDAGLTNVQEAARISAARNFLIGTSVDAGNRLEVNGSARFSGLITGTTGATFGTGGVTINYTTPTLNFINAGSGNKNYNIQVSGNDMFINEAGVQSIFQFKPGGNIIANQTSGRFLIGTTTDAGFKLDVNGTARVSGTITAQTVTFGSVAQATTFAGEAIFGTSGGLGNIYLQGSIISLGNFKNVIAQGGGVPSTPYLLNINGTHTNGSATIQTDLLINTTINYSTSGFTVRGIYYNPTLTALSGSTHIAFESTIGNVCLGTTSGNVLIGTATSGASKLRIVGLPTSAVGLSSGDIYSNLGVLTIVP